MKLLYYNCTFALFIFRLHKLGIEAHAYAHYTSLLCLLCFYGLLQRLIVYKCYWLHESGKVMVFGRIGEEHYQV